MGCLSRIFYPILWIFQKPSVYTQKKACWCVYSIYLLMVWCGMNRPTYDPSHLFSLNLFVVQTKSTAGKEMRIFYNVLC